MAAWVCVVTLESEGDPGAELVQVLRDRFGQSVRTLTQQAWLYEAARTPPPPMGKPPAKTTVLPRARGVR